MPVYEYECTSCSETFEKFQSVGSRPPRRCPSCDASGTVRKRVSAPAFHLKGSGWYVTDYAKKGTASKDSGDASAAKSDSSASDSSKSDSTSSGDAKKASSSAAKST